jgi:hypothetical protein
VSNVYFDFALKPIWFASFSPPLCNGRWILLGFTPWCSLSDDQSSAILLWVLYIVSIVLDLFRCKFFVLILPLVSRSSYSGYTVFCCSVLLCLVSCIYTSMPYDICVGMYWCFIMMSNILFWLSLSFVYLCSSINLLSLLKW